MNYDPSIHHRRSIRLKGYDYSREGLYYITLCTQNRACLFGKIVPAQNMADREYFLHPEQPQMVLNDLGEIANECWSEIPKHFLHAKLHEYVVMPNHIHGIIELEQLWQRNYYETIIRDETSYHNISDYICNNPANWKMDEFHNHSQQ